MWSGLWNWRISLIINIPCRIVRAPESVIERTVSRMRLRNIPGARDVIAVSGYVVHEPEAQKGKWAEVFGNDRPVWVEIGMGKGRFIMDMAEKYPDRNFVGIEMYSSVLFKAIQRAEARAMIRDGADPGTTFGSPASVMERPPVPEGCNFRFICMDARDLESVFEQGEIKGIYLNFSDPWPKERHASRRLTSTDFLRRYEKILPEGGCVEFKTDNQELFRFSLEELETEGWNLIGSTFDLHHDELMNEGNVMTEYEEKFSGKGNPICKLIASPRRLS